jgi:hypothetical protein
MDMFVSNVPSEDLESLPFANHFEYSFQFCFNIDIDQYFTSELGSPNQMILADIRAVAKVIYSSISHIEATSFLDLSEVALV